MFKAIFELAYSVSDWRRNKLKIFCKLVNFIMSFFFMETFVSILQLAYN